jgi:hypothetical protein
MYVEDKMYSNDYEVLSARKPGFYLTQDNMFYLTPKTRRLFSVRPDYISHLRIRSDGVIIDNFSQHLAIFRPANLSLLYTQLFS